MSLHPLQQQALDLARAGKNVFLTGAGGTGKSYVVNLIKNHCRDAGLVFQVAAPTAIAASHVGGCTLHWFANTGSFDDARAASDDNYRERIARKAFKGRPNASGTAHWRWTTTDVLIIDEISMVSKTFFSILDEMARRTRKQLDVPFGGMQVILSGDFFQLPPVKGTFAFLSDEWKGAKLETVELLHSFRQAADVPFLEALGRIRVGIPTAEDGILLVGCVGKTIEGPIQPTLIFSTNRGVDEKNTEELLKLPGTSEVYDADDYRVPITLDKDGAPLPEKKVKEFRKLLDGTLRQMLIPERLELRIGAQVMLLRNLDTERGLVNGARGIVTGFAPDPGTGRLLPRVDFWAGPGRESITMDVPSVTSETILERIGSAGRFQIPLKLAWAITIHKSQGMTLDLAEESLQRIFADGQAYVALSRVRSLAGLVISGPRSVLLLRRACRASGEVLKFYAEAVGLSVEDYLTQYAPVEGAMAGKRSRGGSQTESAKKLKSG